MNNTEPRTMRKYAGLILTILLLPIIFVSSCNSDNDANSPSSQSIADSSTIVIKEVQKVTAYYNASGYIIRQTSHSWNDQSGWIFAHSYQNTYNATGQLITKEIAMPDIFDITKITPLERDSFAYTTLGDTASLVRCIYSPVNNNWTHVSKWVYRYNEHRKIAETALSWDITAQRYHTVYYRTFEYNSRYDITKFKTITPHREDTAQKHIDVCFIQYDENGFETSRNVTVIAE